MHVDFADNSLHRLVTESGFCPPGWDAAESRHARIVTQCAQAAKGLGDLHAMRMLRIQPYGTDPPTFLARLSANRCLLLTGSGADGSAAVLVAIAPVGALTEEWEKQR